MTRSTDQASSLVGLLADRGALPVELPTIKTQQVDDYGRLDEAIGEVERYAWVVFTSANGVRYLADRFEAKGYDIGRLNSAKVVAVGPATARALADLHVRVDLVPSRYVAEGVLDAMSQIDLVGQRILLPVARHARDVLSDGLVARGAIVERVVAYETVPVGDPQQLQKLLADVDIVALTSSSTAQNLVALLGRGAACQMSDLLVASIGPITTRSARDLGLTVQIEASEHTVPGLVAALDAGPNLTGGHPCPHH